MKPHHLFIYTMAALTCLASHLFAAPPEVTVTGSYMNHDHALVPVSAVNEKPATLLYAENALLLPGGAEEGYVGRAGSGTNQTVSNSYLGFKLPSILGPLKTATLTLKLTYRTGSTGLGLYVFAPDKPPRDIKNDTSGRMYDPGTPGNPADDLPLTGIYGVHYYNTSTNPNDSIEVVDLRPTVRLIKETFVTNTSAQDGDVDETIVIDLAPLLLPGKALADFYGPDGEPVSKDGMIWFRISPDHLYTNGNRRLTIVQNKTAPDAPKLEFVYEHVPTASELPAPASWPTSGADTRRLTAQTDYLRLLDRKLDIDRSANVPQIDTALASGGVVPASVLEYAYAQAWRVSQTPHSPTGNAAISRDAFIANPRDALLAATNAMASANPAIVAAQTAELARGGLASLVGIYRSLSAADISASAKALDDAQQTTLATRLSACADALLAQAAPDYGSYGRAAAAARGIAAVANLPKLAASPRRTAWLAYANAVWSDWKHVNDTVENSRSSTGFWLHSTLGLAAELDAAAGSGSTTFADQLKDAGAVSSFARFLSAIAPNNTMPDYGDTDWDHGLAYWLHAFESLGYAHARAEYFRGASAIATYLEANKNIAISDIAGLTDACRAIADTPSTTSELTPGVALTTRIDDLGGSHFDKLFVRTGTSAAEGASFVALNLHDRGGNGGDSAGALSLYTSGSSVLMHATGAGNTHANRQQNAWATAGAAAADLLAATGRHAANTSTRWIVNHRWPGASTANASAAPPLDIASVTGFFLRIQNTDTTPVAPTVNIESVSGVKSDGTTVPLSGAVASGSPSLAAAGTAGDTADIAVSGLSLNLSDYAYLLVTWKSSHPDLVAGFGIAGASLLPTGSADGRPAATTLLTGAGSSLYEAAAQDDTLAPKATTSRIMLDSAGRAIMHHRDLRLRSTDGALFVLDTFEFTEAGNYTVGPVWHVQNIASSGASAFPGASVQVIARDDVQIDNAGSKAAAPPKQMQFDFGSASVTGGATITPITLAFASDTYAQGRNPQTKHFTAAAIGARIAGEVLAILTVIRPNPPVGDASDGITYHERYANFVDGNGRVVVGVNPFPTIETVTYEELTIGGTVILQGVNFTGATQLSIGGFIVPAGQWTLEGDTKITATVPAGIPSTGYIEVTSPRGSGQSPRPYSMAVPPPATQTLIAEQIVIAGKTLTLAGASAGNPAPGWTWQVSKDGGATWETIEGATTNTLVVTNVTAGMEGWQYRYGVSSHAGSATSNACTLHVAKAWLSRPVALVVDQAGDIYVTDNGLFTINRIDTQGRFARVSGTANASSVNGTKFNSPLGKYANPAGISLTPIKTLIVSDAGAHNLYQFDPDKTLVGSATPTVIAGNFPVHNATIASGTLDASGTNARFKAPWGIATDHDVGVTFVADSGNHTIRMVSYGHAVTTIAGKAGMSGATDGVGAAALFNTPTAIAYDPLGQVLYVADTGNNAIRIVDLAPGANQYRVTLYAGSFSGSGAVDGDALDARFIAPQGVAIDGHALLVADTGNATIREIVSGTVTTIAGGAGLHAMVDATGTAARFDHPLGLALDAQGNIWVADSGNATLRKIAPDNKVSTPQWTDLYRVDPPSSSNNGTLNGDLGGGGSGGGSPSWWMLGALGLLVITRNACGRKKLR